MHALVLIFLTILVNVELFTEEAIPVLFQFSLCSLADHLSFNLY